MRFNQGFKKAAFVGMAARGLAGLAGAASKKVVGGLAKRVATRPMESAMSALNLAQTGSEVGSQYDRLMAAGKRY